MKMRAAGIGSLVALALIASTSDADSSMMLAVHAKEGETSSAIFKADTPGTYNIYCTIAGHKDAGMVGMITVTAAS